MKKEKRGRSKEGIVLYYTMKHLLISSCLMGLRTKYDGNDAFDVRIKEIENRYVLIPVCPEVLGGLSIPREPATIRIKDGCGFWEENIPVVIETGKDISKQFREGALRTLTFAKFLKVQNVIFKEGSPSCGVFLVNSSFQRRRGIGIATYLLRKNGFTVDTIASFLKRNF